MVFLNFLGFFASFLGIFCPGSSKNGTRNENCFFSFSANLNPVWIEIMLECCFIAYLILLLLFFFFLNSLSRVGQERNSKQFFFFLFLGLSQPGLDRNNARMTFFNFFEFICFFFFFLGILYPGFCWNRIQSENFFLSFSAYLCAIWIEIMPE